MEIEGNPRFISQRCVPDEYLQGPWGEVYGEARSIESYMERCFDRLVGEQILWAGVSYFETDDAILFALPLAAQELDKAREIVETDLSIMSFCASTARHVEVEWLPRDTDDLANSLINLAYEGEYTGFLYGVVVVKVSAKGAGHGSPY